MWNTVTVQYNPLIEEEFDEHFKVTCEYGYDFWKTVTFPFLDVEWVYCLWRVDEVTKCGNLFHRVATGNPVVFTLSPPECYMEIRNGYGTSGTRVAGKSSVNLLKSLRTQFWIVSQAQFVLAIRSPWSSTCAASTMASILWSMIGEYKSFTKLFCVTQNANLFQAMLTTVQRNASNWLMSSDVRLTISWFRASAALGLTAESSRRKFMPTWRRLGSLVRLRFILSAMFGCVMEDVQ